MKHENNSCLHLLRIGVLINPMAGLGGARALKGSDGLPSIVLSASESKAYQRSYETLTLLQSYASALTFFCPSGLMGEDVLIACGFTPHVVCQITQPTTAEDTLTAVNALIPEGIDLLLFAGGDGTARDLCRAGFTLPVLGIPSGVKMHSGVFAINPESAAELIEKLLTGGGVVIEAAEVRDLDESALQAGKVQPQFYGELNVPVDTRLVQQIKCASVERDELVQTEIAAGVCESLEPDVLYLFGVGTTAAAIMCDLGYQHTLLGFDAVLNGELIGEDLDSDAILALVQQHPTRIILTATGGQGILIGRGNQQLTPEILRYVGRDSLWVVATPNKLNELAGRALRLDTGDAVLNQQWRGLMSVTTGYQQQQLYYVE
jgi:predicted polyphosphate/ATP-dependent NAD kinase